MEKLNICCALHPKETVARVDVEFGAEKELYCVECLLSMQNPGKIGSHLKPLHEFVEMAAKFYDQNRKTVTEGSEAPSEYTSILSTRDDLIEVLTQHIEDEKKRVQLSFDELCQVLNSELNRKCQEYLASLDQELNNFKYGYTFFEKQLNKAYPKEESSDSLYPTHEELLAKFSDVSNVQELHSLIRSIKEDMNDAGIAGDQVSNAEEAKRALISSFAKQLRDNESKKPKFVNNKVEDLNKELKESLSKIVDKFMLIENNIESLVADSNYPKSSIIKSKDFAMIKGWLSKEYQKCKFDPLYKGSKDGFNIQAFHSKCDKKGPTLTLIKTKETGKIFGGFMDQSWASEDTNINSEKAFLFSVSNKAKYPPKNPGSQFVSFSAYDTGPNFGDGDLSLYGDFGNEQQGCYPYTFQYNANDLCGGSNFTVDEIEIYAVK